MEAPKQGLHNVAPDPAHPSLTQKINRNESQDWKKRLKQQMESMEQRMMEALRKMLTPANNGQSNQGNQTKAVRAPEETSAPEVIDPDPSGGIPLSGFQVQDT